MTDWTASVGTLLGSQPASIQHVEEIRIPAGVEWVSPFNLDAAFSEKVDNRPMQNGRAHLCLNVIADQRQDFYRQTVLPKRGHWR